MKLLGLDTLRDVDLLIEKAFCLRQRVADDLARRAKHHRDGLRAVFEGFEAVTIERAQGLARAFIKEPGRHHVENLAFERMRTGADADRGGKIIASGRRDVRVRLKFLRQDVRQIGRLETEGGIVADDDVP